MAELSAKPGDVVRVESEPRKDVRRVLINSDGSIKTEMVLRTADRVGQRMAYSRGLQRSAHQYNWEAVGFPITYYEKKLEVIVGDNLTEIWTEA